MYLFDIGWYQKCRKYLSKETNKEIFVKALLAREGEKQI